jgi:hypothetical protein
MNSATSFPVWATPAIVILAPFEMTIEIIKPFNEAIELTKKILFQPFDLRKWCVMGFAAFLATMGGGFNFNFNLGGTHHERAEFRSLIEKLQEIPPWILVMGGASIAFIILAIVVVFAWLRARGRFMFIDGVVKNRGAIAEPWREFKKEGNSLFLFSLLISCVFLIAGGLLALPFMLPIVRGVTVLHLHDVYLVSMILLWAIVVFLFVMAWAILLHFMVPIMYRRRCRAGEALPVALSLIASYPGEIVLYCLFWILLFIGAAMTGCIATCATCCLALIPYVGTVILLPLFVCLRAFSLLFLQQFGPEYDVFARSTSPLASEPPPLPA